MSDAVLTKKQGLALLQELSTNPGFRKRFMDKPAAALLEIGVPNETIVNLNPMCIAPRSAEELASADVMKQSSIELERDQAQIYLSMWIPNPKVAAPKTF